ncbi:type II secretion system F family protein [Geitlerinema sp. P-1104]|uniref:type II secretion system F family protein n=1 Tax=Geitlerinema sp. P-1104 TaxID=2546230 RepID=UPI001477222C|nr:type II secretion system F family protein [Geitlerinema sp. P-1104]NMG58265.1 type II secretion system F family protein [Geitlerinema sp. P-1104]
MTNVAKAESKGFDLSNLEETISAAISSVTVKDKAVFSRQFAAMFNAGVGMLRCLSVLTEQCGNIKLKRALRAISIEVEEGGSLAEAMRKHPSCFDKLYVSMVAAGEVGGVLDEVLNRLAILLEKSAKIQNELKSAMSYPKTVGGIAIVIFLGMTIFLLPTFTGIFDQLDAELPMFTQIMMNISYFLRGPFLPTDDPEADSWVELRNYNVVIFVAILIGIVFAIKAYYKTPVGRFQIDGLILKAPLFGEIVEKSAVASFCNVFGTLTRSGVPILNAMEIVRDTAGNEVIAEAIDYAKSQISEGGSISEAFRERGVMPALAVQMMSIGEETGELDKMLMKVGEFYEDEVEQAIKGLTSMMEPLMIVVIGGMVGSILLSMYLPMFAVMDAIG